jgi:catalase
MTSRATDVSGGSAPDAGSTPQAGKVEALEPFRSHSDDAVLTTDQGVRIPQTDDYLREKITRFDHERIPERVVHARAAERTGSSRSIGR